MQRHILLFAALAATISGMAQSSPNRVIINNADGTSRSIMTDRVNDISFATIEGEVSIGVEILSVDATAGEISIKIDPTEECKWWKYAIVPEVSLNAFENDAEIAGYVDRNCEYSFTSDIPGGIIDAPGLMAGGEYALCVVAIDRLQTLCDVTAVAFDVDNTVSGNPAVDMTTGNITETSFEVTFTPNSECSRFRYVMNRSGEVESMYEFYGSQMGATSLEDFIANYISYDSLYETTTVSFTDLVRATDYDVYVVPFDLEDNMCPMQKITVQTAGAVEGEAELTIEANAYTMMAVPNPENMLETIYLPYQSFMFTPNDATIKWRAEAYTEAEYEAMGQEAAEATVKREPETGVPDDMWFRYGKRTQSWQFDPDTTVYVLAAGKNGNGEWGKVAVMKYTTPSELPSRAPIHFKNKREFRHR